MLIRFQKALRGDRALGWAYLRQHGIRATLLWLRSREVPVSFQFIKYAALGLITTFVQVGLFTWFSHSFFPAHDYLVEGGIDPALKQRHAVFSNLLAFPFAVLFNYVANVFFVFTPGRHSRSRELLLFVGVSFLTFAAGLFSGPGLISRGLDPWIAQGVLVVMSALLNFVCRKYFVFLR